MVIPALNVLHSSLDPAYSKKRQVMPPVLCQNSLSIEAKGRMVIKFRISYHESIEIEYSISEYILKDYLKLSF